jgi:ectoine hydroxylase-related dioxygenase (phytanoyl-CoA dioxygenase family)
MSYMPEPWGGLQGINSIWCIDDFTEERGATRVVPGSHRQNTKCRDQTVQTVPLLAPAGSMVALDGRVWHGTGANTTTSELRAGIFGWYTKPIYLPQENWWLTLDQSIRKYGSEELKVLFGYKVLAGFGLEFGGSPE